MLDRLNDEAYKAASLFNLAEVHFHLTGVMTKTMHNRISAKAAATGVASWLSDACVCFGLNPNSPVITVLRQGGNETGLLFGDERLSQHG